jgi:hypothetical protein
VPSFRLPALTAAAVAALGFLSAAPAVAADASHSHTGDVSCSDAFYQNDPRLGPRDLPTDGPVGIELAGYHRTGYLTTTQFLDDYYSAATGGYIYPPESGFALDLNGKPIKFTMQLVPGLQIDRYGSEAGGFLAPDGTPYTQRALPPINLDNTASASCNYHDYRVLKALNVTAGPIAPWFAQSGGGLQFQLDSSQVPGAPTPLTVIWLVQHGYLQPMDGTSQYEVQPRLSASAAQPQGSPSVSAGQN